MGYQWLTGITLYGWTSYIGYSRIEIDKHHFTDVVVGALVGMLFEEVYYRFKPDTLEFTTLLDADTTGHSRVGCGLFCQAFLIPVLTSLLLAKSAILSDVQ